MSYQEIFDKEHAASRERMPDSPYNHLVESLEAVFIEAGYGDITAKELASMFHNQVSWSIGETDLVKICTSFIRQFIMPERYVRRYDVDCVIRGDTGITWTYTRCSLSELRICGWEQSITEKLKTEGVRRGSKRYREFMRSNANKAVEKMIKAAGHSIASWRVDMDAHVAESEKRLNAARSFVAGRERQMYVVGAFKTVGQLSEDWGVIKWMAEEIEELRVAIEKYRDSLDHYRTMTYAPEEVLLAGIKGHKDLELLWQYYQEGKGGEG